MDTTRLKPHYPESEIRASHISRYFIRDREGSSGESQVCRVLRGHPRFIRDRPTNICAAVIYAHMVLATEDLVSLRGREPPEGRRA